LSASNIGLLMTAKRTGEELYEPSCDRRGEFWQLAGPSIPVTGIYINEVIAWERNMPLLIN
jgi:hypothetical protein